MALSFRDYITISTAFADAQLDEGKIWDAIKAKLGAKASDEDVEAELERLKKTDSKDLAKIKTTQASRDAAARKAEREAAAAKLPASTGHAGADDARRRLTATKTGNMRAGQSRATERGWALGEETLAEAQEFVVSYSLKSSDAVKRCTLKARDVTDVKRKFADTHYGAKLLSVAPAKKVEKKIAKVEEDFGPLGPRTLAEGKDAKVVVMKVLFDYINTREAEKIGGVTLFHTCETPQKAAEMVDAINAIDKEGGFQLEDDFMVHWGQNSYSDFQGTHGEQVSVESVKIVDKEPALGRRVYAFNPADFGL